jgi:hypothetical protein
MWRYKLVAMGSLSESKIAAWEATLNELGGEGWEAVAVIEQTDGWCVLLKMPHQVATY